MSKYTYYDPPPGVPNQCWNRYKGRFKIRIKTLDEAIEAADPDQDPYFCRYCKFFHVGTTGKPRIGPRSLDREEDMLIEIGERALAQLLYAPGESLMAHLKTQFQAVSKRLYGHRHGLK